MDKIVEMELLGDDSQHSIMRAKERAGLSEKRARKFFDMARKRGIRSNDCRWSLDKSFLASKTDDEVVAVAYNTFCFILQRKTNKCITMYKLPREFGKKKTSYKTDNRMKLFEINNKYMLTEFLV